MPDPTYRSMWEDHNFAGGSTITEPTGTVQGDVMWCYLYLSSDAPIAAPSGWTRLDTIGTGPSAALYRCVRGASAPTLLFDFGNQGFSIYVVTTKDGDTTTPEDATVTKNNGTSATITFPDITTATNGALHLVMGHHVNAGAWWTWSPTPSGMTTHTATSGGSSSPGVVASATKTTAGATGTKTATTNVGSAAWYAFTIAVKPVAAAAGLAKQSVFVRQAVNRAASY